MKKAAKNFKTTNIKGKQYVEVKERIKYLNEEFQGEYSINTSYQYFPDRKMWVVKAILKMKQGETVNIYTGLAQEVESDSFKDVNFTSALENAETSAIGRACAFAGIGIDVSIASADEMNKALNRAQGTAPAQPAQAAAAKAPELSQIAYEQALRLIEAGNFAGLEALTKGFAIPAERGKILAAAVEKKKAALSAANPAPAEAEQPLVKYATARQKEEIIRLLNNVLITRQEKTKMLLNINKFDEERAGQSIEKLKKTIEEREAANQVAAQKTPEMQARNAAATELYELATRNSEILGDKRVKNLYDLVNTGTLEALQTTKEEVTTWLADQDAAAA